MGNKITSLRIAAYRGATAPVSLRFESKPVVVIFGENGTGKSTIADALDLVCNRRLCGSLESYSIPSPSKYVPSLGRPHSAVRIDLISGTKTWTASVGGSGVTVLPSDAPDAHILRRRTILRLIEGKPKDRYEALKELVNVPSIESAETAIRDAAKSTNRELGEATRTLQQASEALDSLWSAEGKPGKSSLEWGESEIGKDQTALRASVTEVLDLESKYAGVASAVHALNSATDTVASTKVAREAAAELRAMAEAKEEGQNASLLALLRDAKAFLVENATKEQCPVCEQSATRAPLIEKLGSRIDSMQELGIAVVAFQEAEGRAKAAEGAVNLRRSDFFKKLRSLATSLQTSSLEPATKVKSLLQQADEFLHSTVDDEDHAATAEALWLGMGGIHEELRALKDANQKSFNLHKSITTVVSTLTDAQTRASDLSGLNVAFDALLSIASQRRKGYIDGILQAIGQEVESLYSQLHPNEALGGVRFFLKQSAIGSLEFDATFHGKKEIPPHAYYSESHLDTLGICVFMARAKLFKTDDTIIVLDDVLTSVDAGHLGRFMTMLQAESAHFRQIIVLTHYRPWRDRYRWAKGPAANTQVIELGPWSIENGLNAFDFVADLQALESALASQPFDRQVIASKAGIALEALLDFLTLKYRCKLSRNVRGEYTLGDLAVGLDGKLSIALKVQTTLAGGSVQETPLKGLIDAATSHSWVRNAVGCHFNVSGGSIPDAEVVEFGKSVVALAKTLLCGTCGTLPTRRPSGTVWQCRCPNGGVELVPLVAPGADLSTIDDEE